MNQKSTQAWTKAWGCNFLFSLTITLPISFLIYRKKTVKKKKKKSQLINCF